MDRMLIKIILIGDLIRKLWAPFTWYSFDIAAEDVLIVNFIVSLAKADYVFSKHVFVLVLFFSFRNLDVKYILLLWWFHETQWSDLLFHINGLEGGFKRFLLLMICSGNIWFIFEVTLCEVFVFKDGRVHALVIVIGFGWSLYSLLCIV